MAKTPPATVITPQKPAETKPADTKPFFGFSPTASMSFLVYLQHACLDQPKAPMFGGGSNTGSSSFSSLANNPSGGTGFLNSSGTNASLFSADPKKFSFLSGGANKAAASKPANEEEGGGENDETAPEEFAPDDSQFKRPDIALPDLINVRTGEEEEVSSFVWPINGVVGIKVTCFGTSLENVCSVQESSIQINSGILRPSKSPQNVYFCLL